MKDYYLLTRDINEEYLRNYEDEDKIGVDLNI